MKQFLTGEGLVDIFADTATVLGGSEPCCNQGNGAWIEDWGLASG